MTPKSANFEITMAFLSPLHEQMGGFLSKRMLLNLKVDLLQDWKNILFSDMHGCTFQPRNVTDRGSEGAKSLILKVLSFL